MEEKGEISKNCGHKYGIEDKDEIELTMVEYDVDDSILFQDRLNKTKFGINLSVQKPNNVKPLLLVF